MILKMSFGLQLIKLLVKTMLLERNLLIKKNATNIYKAMIIQMFSFIVLFVYIIQKQRRDIQIVMFQVSKYDICEMNEMIV